MLHPEHHELVARDVLGWWTFRPFVLASISVSALLYARGCATLWRKVGVGHGISRLRAAAFAAGLCTVVAALVSPVDQLSELLFSVHMSQHELLMIVAAPLIVIGRPIVAALWGL